MKKLVISMTVGLVLAVSLGSALANSLKSVALDAERVQGSRADAALHMR